MGWGSALGSLGRWASRNPEVVKAGFDVGKSLTSGKAASENAIANRGDTVQDTQADQYSKDRWSNETTQQRAIDSALGGADPIRDQERLYTLRAQSDIRNDPAGSARYAPANLGPSYLQGSSVVSYAPSASTTRMAQAPALAKVIANQEANRTAQSRGQTIPMDIGGILGEPDNPEIAALQAALGAQKTSAIAAQATDFNDYLKQMQQAYQAMVANAGQVSGGDSAVPSALWAGLATAAPAIQRAIKSKFKTPTTAQRTGGYNVDAGSQY